ncbi:MAG: hypothetical protein ACP6IY_10965 [Promethearchaeia archaeon]
MGKDDDDKMAILNNKFNDIKGLRDRVISDTNDIANILKKQLAARKALSPDVMVKNFKSITSFLDNFSKMMVNLSSKIGTLSNQIKGISDKLNTIQTTLKSIK